jgi:hypothetical protein
LTKYGFFGNVTIGSKEGYRSSSNKPGKDLDMRVIFVIVAMSILSTSAYAKECYKLSWEERAACHVSDPTYPVRFDICEELRNERGSLVEAAGNHFQSRLLYDCMRKLSPLSMNELIKQGRRAARAQNYARPAAAVEF